MKKLLIVTMLTACFSTVFADKNNPYEILEKRVEKKMEFKYNDSKIEYDIDIYRNQANVKIEGRGSALKKIGPENLAREVVEVLKTEADVNDIFVIIEEDKFWGDDQVIFSQRYN